MTGSDCACSLDAAFKHAAQSMGLTVAAPVADLGRINTAQGEALRLAEGPQWAIRQLGAGTATHGHEQVKLMQSTAVR